ncbi:MAG: Lrp/AsnC ligand binding domain-containing protein [Candidatus Thermoplasmatota archaeon]|nr:Lrp/AsnC ligand binding domain-containing protein [Candidatus Thermoplasmatota archaeon]
MEIEELRATFGRLQEHSEIKAIVGLETDVSRMETTVKSALKLNSIEDLYVVTGDYDILLKVRCPSYEEFEYFLVNQLGKIPGITKMKTMLILSQRKLNGEVKGE